MKITYQSIILTSSLFLSIGQIFGQCVQDVNFPKQEYSRLNASNSINVGSANVPYKVALGYTSILKAGNSITLNPGFEAEKYSNFEASIQSCNIQPISISTSFNKLSDCNLQISNGISGGSGYFTYSWADDANILTSNRTISSNDMINKYNNGNINTIFLVKDELTNEVTFKNISKPDINYWSEPNTIWFEGISPNNDGKNDNYTMTSVDINGKYGKDYLNIDRYRFTFFDYNGFRKTTPIDTEIPLRTQISYNVPLGDGYYYVQNFVHNCKYPLGLNKNVHVQIRGSIYNKARISEEVLPSINSNLTYNISELSIYPNPFVDNLNIDLTDFDGNSLNLTIKDQIGNVVKYFEYSTIIQDKLIVDLSSINQGLYYAQITSRSLNKTYAVQKL